MGTHPVGNQIPPENCPDPSVYGSPFRYCPYCSWTEEPADADVVHAALKKAIDERRQDAEFMGRLRRNIEKHADLLERLAVDD